MIGHCHIVNEGCTAPAGFTGGNGGIYDAPKQFLNSCLDCGELVCKACSTEVQIALGLQARKRIRTRRVCAHCMEWRLNPPPRRTRRVGR